MGGPIKIDWHKVKEIPLSEWDWKSIKLYFDEANAGRFLEWENCVYLYRLSPPYAVKYGNKTTPVVYVGSGAIKQRWSSHREWLSGLGATLPGVRYEVWIAEHPLCREIEADILCEFRTWSGYLPLRNLKAAKPANLSYAENELESLVEYDKRYSWALFPVRKDVEDPYYTRSSEI